MLVVLSPLPSFSFLVLSCIICRMYQAGIKDGALLVAVLSLQCKVAVMVI